MASKDFKNNGLGVISIGQTSGGNVNGGEVDTWGDQKFEGVTLFCGVDGSAAGTIKIQESDVSGSGFADVADSDVITTAGTNDIATVASSVVSIGYIGTKRYVRAVFTQSSSGVVSAIFVLTDGQRKPVSGN